MPRHNYILAMDPSKSITLSRLGQSRHNARESSLKQIRESIDRIRAEIERIDGEIAGCKWDKTFWKRVETNATDPQRSVYRFVSFSYIQSAYSGELEKLEKGRVALEKNLNILLQNATALEKRNQLYQKRVLESEERHLRLRRLNNIVLYNHTEHALLRLGDYYDFDEHLNGRLKKMMDHMISALAEGHPDFEMLRENRDNLFKKMLESKIATEPTVKHLENQYYAAVCAHNRDTEEINRLEDKVLSLQKAVADSKVNTSASSAAPLFSAPENLRNDQDARPSTPLAPAKPFVIDNPIIPVRDVDDA